MRSRAQTFCIIISLLLLTYTIIRGFKLSFTHDESFTYLYCSQDSFMEIISNRTKMISANNHILNTLFVKLFSNFSNTELSLRFQSILAHVIYLIFTFMILKNLKSTLVLITGFIILNVNPYLLEFFSLARGYALAISFMIAAIYFFITYLKTERQNQLIASLIAASIAVLSNFALLNFFAAIILIHQIILYWRYKSLKINLSNSKPVLTTILILGLVCYEPLRKLIKYNQFNFGGMSGIWDDTVWSLIDVFLYKKNYDPLVLMIIQWIVILVIGGYSSILIYRCLKKKLTDPDNTGLLFLSILFLILLSNSLQHHLFNSPYLVERFALFLVPLFGFILIFLLNFLMTSEKPMKIIGFSLSSGLIIAMLWHFNNCYNFKYTFNWDYDADTKNMLLDLSKEKENTKVKKVRLGITWLFEPTINFYRQTKNLDWLEEVDRKGIRSNYDYYYVAKIDEDKIPKLNKTLIKKYPVSESTLLK